MSDHRKSLTDPLPALVPELIRLMSKAMDNIPKDSDFQYVTEPKKRHQVFALKSWKVTLYHFNLHSRSLKLVWPLW